MLGLGSAPYATDALVAVCSGGHLDGGITIGGVLVAGGRDGCPDAIRADNVDRLRARMVAQGANIGVTRKAEERLHDRGVLSLPDFIVNAGGVICAAVEYAGGTRTQAFATIEERIRDNLAEVLDRAASSHRMAMDAAREMADARVRRAMTTRRWT